MARSQTSNQNLAPFYAVIGVGDLAVEKIRAVGTDVQARSTKLNLEPKQLQADIEAVAKQRVDDVRSVQHKAQQRAEEVFSDVVAQATTTYDSLAGRGKKLVDRIRRQESTKNLARTASQTKSQAKATSTTAKKNASTTASSAKKSASKTASTAKQSASQTRSRAKATSTSARKTADNATTAAQQAAEKVGD